ncbi:MAG: hypothetical protein JO023_05250 [Chloroflexi bacterium]|nr:hypothetical protein [Chloroflexota bacterium]
MRCFSSHRSRVPRRARRRRRSVKTGPATSHPDAYYTGVSALIQTPVASDDPKVRSASVSSWVGIGRTDSSDLIQAGVEVDTSRPETSYHAWYETLPEASQTTSLEVHGGDWVQVDIEEGDSNQWEIKIVDGQQVFQIVVAYTSSHSSAEWIVEDPSAAQGLVPLASVNGANFSKMAAIANGASAVPAQLSAKRIAMVSGATRRLCRPRSDPMATVSVWRRPPSLPDTDPPFRRQHAPQQTVKVGDPAYDSLAAPNRTGAEGH